MNIKPETIKPLEENIGAKVLGIGLVEFFKSDTISKSKK